MVAFCLGCDWVLNVDFDRKKLADLCIEIAKEVSEVVGVKEAQQLVVDVLRNINSKKKIKGIGGKKIPICRYCLLDFFILHSKNEKVKEKLIEIRRIYDFGGAIIC